MHLSKFFNSYTGKIIMSVILGIGLATLFRTSCKGKNCIVLYAPNLEEVDGKIFKQDNKCYKFSTSSIKCDANKKSVKFDTE